MIIGTPKLHCIKRYHFVVPHQKQSMGKKCVLWGLDLMKAQVMFLFTKTVTFGSGMTACVS